MKNINKNPIVWFLAAVAIGGLMVETENFEFFVIFISAVILAKQIEILSK